ncbi:MAG: endopeptidase La [Myxococcota bacterium]|nr:endopeptidase La [Myxococcota bacterium]
MALRNRVFFPQQVSPLMIGRERSKKSLLEAFHKDKLVLLSMEKDGGGVCSVGTLAKILQLHRLPDDTLKVLMQGETRVEITEETDVEGVLLASYQTLSLEDGEDSELLLEVQKQLRRLFEMDTQYPKELRNTIEKLTKADDLIDTMVAVLQLEASAKQTFLEEQNSLNRIQLFRETLQQELMNLEISRKIERNIKGQMESNQREYYLNEKKKAISRELGDDDSDQEWDDYQSKIDAISLSTEAKKKAEKELLRLKRMNPVGAEATVSRNYLDWILALPWSDKNQEDVHLLDAKKVLDAEHFALEEIKDRILEHLAVQKCSDDPQQPILCFLGPPGIGKTSLVRSIAKATKRAYVRQALGGVRDEAEIRGHRRTYIGAMPGKIIQGISRAGTGNPVFLLDEIDKMSGDFHHGDPAAALLEALDFEQNHSFRDHFLDLDYDLSSVFFICTANSLDGIPAPLQDRLEIIELSSYTEEEKLQIATQHLIPKQRRMHALSQEQFSVSEDAIRMLIRRYSREAGVRNLERLIAKGCRKLCRMIVEGEKGDQLHVSETDIVTVYGAPKYFDRQIGASSKIGVMNGLAVTTVGGMVLKIEALCLPGEGKIQLTGRLGDWLKESAHAGISFLRSQTDSIRLDVDFHKKHDFHIHYPGNPAKADGPSAGVAMCMAVLSAITRKAIPETIAITGEISLGGEVLAVGGIKEKLLAAHRQGIQRVFIPLENEGDLQKIPKEVLCELEISLVERVESVIESIFET